VTAQETSGSILVVEDEPAVAKVLKNYLTRCGFEVSTAADADEAQAACDKAMPDALLVDMVLPGKSGLDLVKAMRATEAGATVPVVLMSGVFSVATDEPVARDLNISGFLPKPITLPQLLATLKRALAGAATVSEAGTGERSSIDGELGPRAVADAMLQLLSERRSGVLRLQHGDDEITITVLRGVPVNSRSSLRQHTLGSFLLAVGRLDESQILEVDREMRSSKLRFGEAAAQLGLVKPAEVVDLLRGAVMARVAHAAAWSAGKMEFAEDAAGAEKSALAEIDPVEAIVSGYLKHADIAEAVSAFGVQRHLHVCPTSRFDAYATYVLQEAPDSKLVEAVASSPQLSELMVALQQSGEAGVRELYALWAARLVSFDPQPGQLPDDGPAASEVLQHAPRSEERAQSPETDAIFSEYLRCQGADYYGVLGVDRGAAATAVEQAGQGLLERLSAPEIAAVSEPTACARLEEVRHWVSTALQVLTDAERRADYDRTLEGYAGAAPAGIKDSEAEALYREGREALGRQDYDAAMEALRAAVERCPGDPDYAATLGRVETRRAQIDAQRGFERLVDTCARNPRSARAHLFLGLVMEERGETEKASDALRRAVELDPGLSEAQEALARVSGSERDLYGELFGDLPFA